MVSTSRPSKGVCNRYNRKPSRFLTVSLSPYIRANMVSYLTALLQNTCDYDWTQVKGAHQVLLSNIEEGIVNWSDLKRCHKIRKECLLAAVNGSVSSNVVTSVFTIPCKEYQQDKCSYQKTHQAGSVTHKHACAYCLYTHYRWYNHGEFHIAGVENKIADILSKWEGTEENQRVLNTLPYKVHWVDILPQHYILNDNV